MEPFGGIVEDYRAGISPAATVNVNLAEGADPVSPLDFYGWHRPPPKPIVLPPTDDPQELARRKIMALAH